MPKISAFLISESMQNVPTPNGGFAPQLTGPTIAVRPLFIPSSFSFAITIGVSDVDPAQKNQIQVKIQSPSGETVNDTGIIDLPVDESTDSELPLEYRGFLMNMDLRNVAIKTSGCYIIQVYINGELIDSHEMPVYKRAEPK